MNRSIRDKRGVWMIIPAIAVVSMFIVSDAAWDSCTGTDCVRESFPDDSGRFNGLRWGQSLGGLPGMRFTSYNPSGPGELYYTHEGDLLQLGDAKLEYVQYGFWRGLYASLVFGVKGGKNGQALKQLCFESLGTWYKPDWRIERYYWVGTNTAMTLDYDEAISKGELYVYSKEIYERQIVEERGTMKEPRQRFWLY